MPSRDAKSHGTDVPWNGDEEDWPRARDMYHAILRDEFGSDIADTMWYDKVPTDSFDFDVETACLSAHIRRAARPRCMVRSFVSMAITRKE